MIRTAGTRISSAKAELKRRPGALPPRDTDQYGRYSWKPTGRYRLRKGIFGRIILEQEVDRQTCSRQPGDDYSPDQYGFETKWRRSNRGAIVMLERLR